MIFIILIILIIFLYFFKFGKDRNKMLTEKVDQKGGMLNKYNILTDFFLSKFENATLSRVTRDSIVIFAKSHESTTFISINQGFGKVVIRYEYKNLYQEETKHNWEFSENHPQMEIINVIESGR